MTLCIFEEVREDQQCINKNRDSDDKYVLVNSYPVDSAIQWERIIG